MKSWIFPVLPFVIFLSSPLPAQEFSPDSPKQKSPGRLSISSTQEDSSRELPFTIPLPAHASKPPTNASSPGFKLNAGRSTSVAAKEEDPAQAEYFLPDRNQKPAITPENSNLNLPADLEITAADSGEKIVLPAGTYRQILLLPINSPLMQTAEQIRRNQAPPVEVRKTKSRYAEPEKKPIWVRYESLEKIKIGEAERRGGIDLPSHGPRDLGPRVWYAKSETADTASSVFYFLFGGLGYGVANLAGWSAGNTREIPGDFEYRLIRR